MKVLELLYKWSSGGVERYVEDLVTYASNEGIVCSVASATTPVVGDCIQGDGPLVSNGIRGVLTQGSSIVTYIQSGCYDVVHIHGNNGLVYLLSHYASIAGAKSIVHSHNSSFGPGARAAKAMFTSIMRLLYGKDCSVYFACSHLAGDFLFRAQDYKVVYNGVDLSRFSYRPLDRIAVRHELGIPSEAPVVGFAASLVDAKNPIFAFAVYKQLQDMVPDARFVVCGDGELFDRLISDAEVFSGKNLFICTGRVSDVQRYYSAMDILLAPSRYEGLPINLIEAQANGLPIAMSDAITEEVVVVPELCSRLSLDDDLDVWARAIVNALNRSLNRSDGFVERVQAAGYSQPECFESIVNAYRKVLASEYDS